MSPSKRFPDIAHGRSGDVQEEACLGRIRGRLALRHERHRQDLYAVRDGVVSALSGEGSPAESRAHSSAAVFQPRRFNTSSADDSLRAREESPRGVAAGASAAIPSSCAAVRAVGSEGGSLAPVGSSRLDQSIRSNMAFSLRPRPGDVGDPGDPSRRCSRKLGCPDRLAAARPFRPQSWRMVRGVSYSCHADVERLVEDRAADLLAARAARMRVLRRRIRNPSSIRIARTVLRKPGRRRSRRGPQEKRDHRRTACSGCRSGPRSRQPAVEPEAQRFERAGEVEPLAEDARPGAAAAPLRQGAASAGRGETRLVQRPVRTPATPSGYPDPAEEPPHARPGQIDQEKRQSSEIDGLLPGGGG